MNKKQEVSALNIEENDISAILAVLQKSVDEKQHNLDIAIIKKSIVFAEERFLLLREEQIKAIRQLQENQRNTTEFYEAKLSALEEKMSMVVEEIYRVNKETLDSMLKPVENAIQKAASEFKFDINQLRSTITDIDAAGKQVFLSVIKNFSGAKKDFEKTIELTKQKNLQVFNRLYFKRNVIDILVIITSILGFTSFCFGFYFILYR